jgi:hypothetical protein
MNMINAAYYYRRVAVAFLYAPRCRSIVSWPVGSKASRWLLAGFFRPTREPNTSPGHGGEAPNPTQCRRFTRKRPKPGRSHRIGPIDLIAKKRDLPKAIDRRILLSKRHLPLRRKYRPTIGPHTNQIRLVIRTKSAKVFFKPTEDDPEHNADTARHYVVGSCRRRTAGCRPAVSGSAGCARV